MEGSDPKQWHTGIHTFRKVRYRNAYPGIDLVFYGTQGEIEFDDVVAEHDRELMSSNGRGFGLMPAFSLSKAAQTAIARIEERVARPM